MSMLIKKNIQNGKRAIAYIRVSSMKQVDKGVSIPAQKGRIEEYCKFKKLDLMEKDVLIEDGVSGGNWQGSSISRTIENKFHEQRLKFQQPQKWGSKPWQRK